MSYIIMLFVGLIIGAIARFLFPGHEHMGLLMTSILGIAGSYMGGFLSGFILQKNPKEFHPAGFVFSVIGALLLLYLARYI